MLLRIIVLLVVIGITWSLLYIKPNAKKILQRPFLTNAYLDVELKYQVITLLLAFLTLVLVFIVAPTSFQKYFSFGNISAPVMPVPAIGISPAPNETWLQIGINFAVIISVVTFIFIYLQLIKGKRVSQENLRLFFWIIIFALMNSFTEEMITRFSVVALLDSIIPLSYIYLVSAFIFGTVHYFGTPGKIPGILLAGFLGWFLAKSIGETQGIFWAWTIHFLQDVVIITGLFFQQFAQTKKNG